MLSTCLGSGKSVCVHEKVSAGGKNGSCQRVARAAGKLPSFFPAFARQRAGPIILSEVCGGWGISDTAKRYPERRRTSSCNAEHSSSLIELRWAGGGGEGPETIPRRSFTCSHFSERHSLSPTQFIFLSHDSVIGAWHSVISPLRLLSKLGFISRACS